MKTSGNAALTKANSSDFGARLGYGKPNAIAVRHVCTGKVVENPINRYSLGSDNKMVMNKDGTVTLYLQSESPGPD